jgi:glc operon protein GlcG
MLRTLGAPITGLALVLGLAGGAQAQLVDKKALTLAEARKIAAVAEAEANKNNLRVAIAILDDGGHPLLFERLDDASAGSVDTAIAKGRTAVLFKRETKLFEEAVAGGRTVILKLDGVIPIEGGVPLVYAGKVIGAIGVSGATAQQDGMVARAAAAVLK